MTTPDEYWPNEDVKQLRAEWASPNSTAEIARRMKRSKNSIVGKAHRLGLPGRPSPIKRNGIPQPPKIARAPAKTLAPLQSAAVAAVPVRAPAPTVHRTQKCQWPMWSHTERPGINPKFCDAPVSLRRDDHGQLVARSYCAEHCVVAYTRVPAAYHRDAA